MQFFLNEEVEMGWGYIHYLVKVINYNSVNLIP